MTYTQMLLNRAGKQLGLACITMLLSLSMVSSAVAQNYPAVSHDTWSSGTPMPKAIMGATAAVLGNRIIVFGGAMDWNLTGVLDTLVYNPASNTWSKGVPLPEPIFNPSAAVVNNVLYVFGGVEGSSYLNTVWAYSPQTKTWSAKSPVPTETQCSGAVVAKAGTIYVIGGDIGWTRLNNVDSYNPATDTWTEEAPLRIGRSCPTVGLIGTRIWAADGDTSYRTNRDIDGPNGDIEGYNPSTNTWKSATRDPTPRDAACGGSIGSQLYVAGGDENGSSILALTESFDASNNTWTTLAPMPQGTMWAASAVYNGKLYCFGGTVQWDGTVLNNVQIYQP
jgi:N-acetylneuraminic acid mutarotase